MDNRIKIPSNLLSDNADNNQYRQETRVHIANQFLDWRNEECDRLCNVLTSLLNAGYKKGDQEVEEIRQGLQIMIDQANEEASSGGKGEFVTPAINGIWLSYFKPGKEVSEIKNGEIENPQQDETITSTSRNIKNPNDMRVTISSRPAWKASFGELTLSLTQTHWEYPESYFEIIALLTRMIYHIDHKTTDDGIWHWMPDDRYIDRLIEIDNTVREVNVIEMCLVIDGLCNNEDIKYMRLNQNQWPNKHIGRSNTIRTLIAVSNLLSATNISELESHLGIVTRMLGLSISTETLTSLNQQLVEADLTTGPIQPSLL